MNDMRLDSFVRALMADTAAAAHSLAVGQVWTGRVVDVLPDERLVIMLGDLRLLAQSSIPLSAGQRFSVEVASAGETCELRLRSTGSTGEPGPTLRLMAGPPPGSREVRALMPDATIAVEQFVVGEQRTGHVVQALSGDRYVVQLGEARVLARSPIPLSAGDRLDLEVANTRGSVELRVRSAVPQAALEETVRLVHGMPLRPPAAVGLPIEASSSTPLEGERFTVGQQWPGRVARVVGPGRYVMVLGDTPVVVESSLPLTVGQHVEVDVLKAGTSVELRVRSAVPAGAGEKTVRLLPGPPPSVAPSLQPSGGRPTAGVAPAQYELAALINALSAAYARGVPSRNAAAQAAGTLRDLAAACSPRPSIEMPAVAVHEQALPRTSSPIDVEIGPDGVAFVPHPARALAATAPQEHSTAAPGTASPATAPHAIAPQVLAPSVTPATADVVGNSMRALMAALSPSSTEALARILQPLAPDATPDETALALRRWLRDGGFLFESHARSILADAPAAASSEVVAALGTDLRTLLGRLVEAARKGPSQAEDPFTTAGRAGRSTTEAIAEALADDVPPAAANETRLPHAIVSDRLLSDQVELAYRWLHEGVLAFEVPVRLPDGECRALVQFRREGRPATGEPGRAGACTISVHVESPVFGPVHATARWRGGECEADFFVATPLARDVLADHLSSLKSGLGTVFERVRAEICVDEKRARRPSTEIRATKPRGGGILSVRI